MLTCDVRQLLNFLSSIEQIKKELRHSWLSDGRQESTAEHCWRLALMVMLVAPYLQQTFDVDKAIKMALLHDIVEAEVGDIPVFDITEDIKKKKYLAECAAINNIKATLNNTVGDQFYTVWMEFEDNITYEAKVVNALDKLECKLQHVESPLDTWNDKELALSFDWEDSLYDVDPVILEIKRALYQSSKDKVDAVECCE